MLFGEIVEPSTRALIDDECEDYPEYVKSDVNWEGKKKPPNIIDSLIFVESNKLIKLFNFISIKQENLISSLKNADVNIYQLPQNKFVAVYSEKELTTGEIIEAMEPWISKAKHLYGMTSAPISTYFNPNLHIKPNSFIRVLATNDSPTFSHEQLESPNLITGLGANLLSYCIHTERPCSLFIIYLDSCPFDSTNTTPLIGLIKKLELPTQLLGANINVPSSNLYM